MLIDLIEKIQDTQAEIAKVEELLKKNPDSLQVKLALRSLIYRNNTLEKRFNAEAAREMLEVCSYRLIFERGARHSVLTIGRILRDFQSLFTLVYEALKNEKPKEKVTFSVDTLSESTFDFGYAFTGSLGFVLTMPNTELFQDETLLDNCMKTVFDMARTKDSKEISSYAVKLGSAPVRKLYEWAGGHIDGQTSADIIWKRDERIKAEMLIQIPELQKLRTIINETGETTEIVFSERGYLYAADLIAKSFRMDFENTEPIRGRLDENFKATGMEGGELVVGRHYLATIKKERRIRLSTEKEEVTYTLLAVE